MKTRDFVSPVLKHSDEFQFIFISKNSIEDKPPNNLIKLRGHNEVQFVPY